MASGEPTEGHGAHRARAREAKRSRRRVPSAPRGWCVESSTGCSIGRLADATRIPKSSVYVPSAPRELQLATIDAARTSFAHEVDATPALPRPRPGARLLGLCEAFLSLVERRVFPDGCFFVATSASSAAARPRPRPRSPLPASNGTSFLQQTTPKTKSQGGLRAGHRPRPARLQLGTILTGCDIIAVLHSDDAVIDRARQAIRHRLGI